MAAQFKFTSGINLVMITCSIVLSVPVYTMAQKADSVFITSKDLNTSVLREGTHRYLVYFRMKPGATRTNVSFWTRKIERSSYQGRQAIVITQEWEDKDTIMHTVRSVSDARTMAPLYHEYWWKQRLEAKFDFLKKTGEMNGTVLTASDTARIRKMSYDAFTASLPLEKFNWHIDLETFPLLPFREGVTFVIPFFDPGPSALTNAVYTVTGSAKLKGYDDQLVDCWLLAHETPGNKEVFWISKKTREVLQLVQEVNGSMWRYKIKLGFSE
ncbi:MAG: hypothetical protein EOO05_03355 [Chitinophagaceae bacterium]|nr:MAG: hypothetical protein EOO05_03355 [Chitinophagaceae bacterium]